MSELVVTGQTIAPPAAPAPGTKPTVLLEWERGPSAPDYFALKVDGEIVEDRLDPADLVWATANRIPNASMTRDTDGNGQPDGHVWSSEANITNKSVTSDGHGFSFDAETTRSLRSATFVAAPGEVWTASLTGLISSGPGQWWPRVEFLDALDAVLGGQDGAIQTGASHRAEVTGTAPAGTTKVRAVVVIQNSAAGTAAYRVGFEQLEAAAAATAWTPGNGEAYRYTYYRAKPRTAQTYEVIAVTDDVGVLKLSTGNRTAAATTTPSGVWIVVPARGLEVVLYGREDLGIHIGEDGETFTPGRKPVRITRRLRGYEGVAAGLVIDRDWATAEQFQERLERIKELVNTEETRVIVGRHNIPVILENFDGPTPHPEGQGVYRFSAPFRQSGEYSLAPTPP